MKANQWYFYRVERDDGVGPYVSRYKEYCRWMIGAHDGQVDEYHPDIQLELFCLEEVLDQQHTRFEDCLFGFQTLTQLQRWFDPEELRKLNRLGYRIVRVLGVEVVSTSTQSMFVRV